MKCPICSKEIADDAKYCLGCGGRIPRCPTCNKVLSRSETFCTYDGTRIPEDVLAVYATPEPPKVSPATNNSNAGQQSAPAVNNNMNKNAAPKPPKSKIPVWILVVLAIFVFSSATLAFVVVSNMLVSNSSGKDTKKVAKNDDDDDDEKTQNKKSKKKSKESETDEGKEASEGSDETMASLDPSAGQTIDNQAPSYETPQATNMVPVTIPSQAVPQTPPPTTVVYYYQNYGDTGDMVDYFIYNSGSMYFTEADIMGFNADDCRLARNGIYARMGRKFKDAGLTNYFSQFYWYNPTIEPDSFSDSWLNSYQLANRDLIVSYERRHGFN